MRAITVAAFLAALLGCASAHAQLSPQFPAGIFANRAARDVPFLSPPYMADFGDSRAKAAYAPGYTGSSPSKVATYGVNGDKGWSPYLPSFLGNRLAYSITSNYGVDSQDTAGFAGRLTKTGNDCNYGSGTAAYCLTGATATTTSSGNTSGGTSVATTGNPSGPAFSVSSGSPTVYFSTLSCAPTNTTLQTGANTGTSFTLASNLTANCNSLGVNFVPAALASNFTSYFHGAATARAEDIQNNVASTGVYSIETDPAQIVFAMGGDNDVALVSGASTASYPTLLNWNTILDGFSAANANKVVVAGNEGPIGLATGWGIGGGNGDGAPEVWQVPASTTTCGSVVGAYCLQVHNHSTFFTEPFPTGTWQTGGPLPVISVPCGGRTSGSAPQTYACGTSATASSPNAFTAGSGDGTVLTPDTVAHCTASPPVPVSGTFCITGAGIYTFNSAQASSLVGIYYRYNNSNDASNLTMELIRDYFNSNASTTVVSNGTNYTSAGAQYQRPWLYVADTWDAIKDPNIASITNGGTGYGNNLTGTMTWNGGNCSVNPVLNVTTNGSGVISTINSVSPGTCNPPPSGTATNWVVGGALSAGSGAEFALNCATTTTCWNAPFTSYDSLHYEHYGSVLVANALATTALATGRIPPTPTISLPTTLDPVFSATATTGTTSPSYSCAAGSITGGTPVTAKYFLTSLVPSISGVSGAVAQQLYPTGHPLAVNNPSTFTSGQAMVDCWDTTNNQVHLTPYNSSGFSGSGSTGGTTGAVQIDSNLFPGGQFCVPGDSLCPNAPTSSSTNTQYVNSTTVITGCSTANYLCPAPSVGVATVAGYPGQSAAWALDGGVSSGSQQAVGNYTLGLGIGLAKNPLGDNFDAFVMQAQGYANLASSGTVSLPFTIPAQTSLAASSGDYHRAICRVMIAAGPNGHLYGLKQVTLSLSDQSATGTTFSAPGDNIAADANNFKTWQGQAGASVSEYSDASIQTGAPGVQTVAGANAFVYDVATVPAQMVNGGSGASMTFTLGITWTGNYEPQSWTVYVERCGVFKTNGIGAQG